MPTSFVPVCFIVLVLVEVRFISGAVSYWKAFEWACHVVRGATPHRDLVSLAHVTAVH